jgi:hypothetical protein
MVGLNHPGDAMFLRMIRRIILGLAMTALPCSGIAADAKSKDGDTGFMGSLNSMLKSVGDGVRSAGEAVGKGAKEASKEVDKSAAEGRKAVVGEQR